MARLLDRRDFLKTTGAAGVGLGLAGLSGPRLLAADLANGGRRMPKNSVCGWVARLSPSIVPRFRCYRKDGFPGIEVYRELRGATPQRGPSDHTVPVQSAGRPADAGQEEAGRLGRQAAEPLRRRRPVPRLFDFAKDMGMEMLIAEPPADDLDTCDKLCEEYGFPLAITNHPKPALYWNPTRS